MTIPNWNMKDHGYGSGFDLRNVQNSDPDMHRYILGYFSDYVTARYASDVIKEKWPQFNPKTKINEINSYQYNIVLPRNRSVRNYPTVRVIISGWNKLKYYLFSGPTLKDLDDPDKRIKYSKELRSAIFHAPIFWLWRVVGTLTRNKNLYNRGTRLEQDFTRPIADDHDVVTLRLERIYVTRGFSLKAEKNKWPYSDVETITCAYYPPSDTLFVYKR